MLIKIELLQNGGKSVGVRHITWDAKYLADRSLDIDDLVTTIKTMKDDGALPKQYIIYCELCDNKAPFFIMPE